MHIYIYICIHSGVFRKYPDSPAVLFIYLFYLWSVWGEKGRKSYTRPSFERDARHYPPPRETTNLENSDAVSRGGPLSLLSVILLRIKIYFTLWHSARVTEYYYITAIKFPAKQTLYIYIYTRISVATIFEKDTSEYIYLTAIFIYIITVTSASFGTDGGYKYYNINNFRKNGPFRNKNTAYK